MRPRGESPRPPIHMASPRKTPTKRATKEDSEEDYASATSLLKLVDYLDKGGKLSVPSIMKRSAVSQGTAKKYLTFLKQHRALTATSQGAEKFWRLAAGAPKTRAFDEVAALELSLRSATWLTGTPYYDLLCAQLAEAREGIPAHDQDRLQTFVRSFCHRTQGDASYTTKRIELERLLRAIRERRPCRFSYARPDGELREYHVHPLLMVLYKERVYLLARKVEQRTRRTFVLDSVSEVVVDDDAPPFAIADSRFTEPEHVFRHSFGLFTDVGDAVPIELEVRGHALGAFTRRRIHPMQDDPSPIGDGWSRVRLTVALCPEVRSFILSLIPDVRVVAPGELRDELVAAAQKFCSSRSA